MKLKGIVEILVFNFDDGIVFHGIQENLIPDASWLGVLGNDSVSNYFGSRRISIATDSTTPNASVSTVAGVIGTCATPSGVTSPVFIENVDPPYGMITGQISPTGISRTFNSVALTGLTAADTQAVASTTAYARLLLDIPCTQGIADFVNITYSIQFLDNIGDGILDKTKARYDQGRLLFGFGQFRMSNIYYNLASPYFSAIALPPAGVSTTTSGSASNANFKWNYTKTLTKTDFLGAIINSIPQGLSNDSTECYALGYYEFAQAPIQTGFKHSAPSTIPFFDSVNIANSQGYLVLNGSWTGSFPEFYKFNFTASGATGVATYKFTYFKHVGFTGNTYTFRDVDALYCRPQIKYANGLHGWKEEDYDKQAFGGSKIVQFDSTGVSVVNLMTGANTNYDSTTTPALLCTSIRQVATDNTNQLIYVACRDTGLWIINVGSNSITNPLTNPCYGVDVGRNNIAVAIVNGGIYRSDDAFAAPKTFTYPNISDDWSRVKFLKADPEHVNNRIAIVTANPANTANRVVWHQFSDNVSTTGYENASVQPYPASLDVSDTGSNWFIYLNGGNFTKITYGLATLSTTYGSFFKPLVHSVYGSRNFSKISFYGDSLFSTSGIAGQLNGGAVITGFSIGNLYFYFNPSSGTNVVNNLAVIHLDSGISLLIGSSTNGGVSSALLRQVLGGNSTYYTFSYGWNGSSWVLNNANSKTTHTSTDTLINGLTVRFQDGASAPHFINGEFQTQGVNYGLLKDNATDSVWKSAWYSKTIHNETITPTVITSPLTLPATTDTYFRKLDTDSTAIPHRFYINGVLATKVWVDGTAPAVSEVSMLANGNGVLTFNAADISKTLTGSYVWIEV